MSSENNSSGLSNCSLIVAGSRSLDQPAVNHHLVESGRRAVARAIWAACPFDRTDVAEVVSGTARGPDRWGEAWAEPLDFVELKRMPADWDTHGKRAGPIRNEEMAQRGDALLAFYDGESAGTRNMIETARSEGLIVVVVDMSETSTRRVIVTGQR